MSNLFLEDTRFGSLYMKNIYEFFEGPKFFSVTNEVDGIFLLYWIGDEEEYDKWFFIPISAARLEHLERQRIDIHQSILYQEQRYFYEIHMPYDDECEAKFIRHNAEQVNKLVKLPKEGLFISGVIPVLQTGKLGEQKQFSTHEIHIEKSKSATKPLQLNGVSILFESFNELYNSILGFFDKKDVMIPVDARPGSFVLSFKADEMLSVEKLLSELGQLIARKLDIIPFIKQHKIDAQCLSALFQGMIDTSSDFELKSNNSDEIILKISKRDAEIHINKLARMASEYVGSHQVPQANIMEKIFQLVDLMWKDTPITIQSIGLDARHVAYYKHAARVLGFINQSGYLSAIGQQIAETTEIERRYAIAARCFESSHCGWAWIMWSGVKNLSEIDAKTADEFLNEKCLSLSDKTKIRRASTLRQWCEVLKPHYRSI